MKLFRFNPTIREANKYLSKTVDELLKKHSGVSNDDFEHDLVNTTGIGWKQVKNYRNHPKPSERLKDNAVVLKFVLHTRARDTGRKVRRMITMLLGAVVVIYAGYWYATKPREIEQFVIHEVPPEAHKTEVAETRVFLKLPSKGWLFRLGPLEHSRLPMDLLTCMDILGTGTKNCSFRETDTQATLIMDGNVVRRYTVISFIGTDIASMKEQLNTLLGEKIARFPAATNTLDELTVMLGPETVHLMATGAGQNMRPMLSVTVSLK